MLSSMKFLAPLLACMFMAVQLHAAPAPWYQWRSKVDGKRVCSQTPLGPGWEKAAGPFRDSRCEKRIVVK
jgi:hypothetical protein